MASLHRAVLAAFLLLPTPGLTQGLSIDIDSGLEVEADLGITDVDISVGNDEAEEASDTPSGPDSP